MSFVVVASGHAQIASSTDPQTITLPSSYSTQPGDCIVLFVASGLFNPTLNASGCGATWTTSNINTNAATFVGVGANCTAGGTSVSVTGNGTGNLMNWIILVFTGVLTMNPVRGGTFASGGASAGLTIGPTQSLPYVAGDLLIGCAGWSSRFATLPAIWSNGGTDNTGESAAGYALTYQTSNAGTATTYTLNISAGGNIAGRAQAFALQPAPGEPQVMVV